MRSSPNTVRNREKANLAEVDRTAKRRWKKKRVVIRNQATEDTIGHCKTLAFILNEMRSH